METSDFADVLKRIKSQAEKENIRLTQHAQQEMIEEDITIDEVFDAISSSKVLENYPEHRRGSCCLLNGKSRNGAPVHIVCTTSLSVLIIITAYRPKLPKWVTPIQRSQ
ncbi:MAG: DUF4258 domain-containing protein [Candidatus Scalindua sp.]|jgi:hypothetical protein